MVFGRMNHTDTILQKKLRAREEQGLLRILKNPVLTSIDFTSNDYLGLARSQELFTKIQDKTETLTNRINGSTGSRLLSGNNDFAEETESKLAKIFKSESALIFNSGYSANLAVLSSIPQRHDTILYDELAHACMKDGARLSLAKRMSFRHNDLNDLESKLKKAAGKTFIAVESIYSMDGDECPLEALTVLSEKYHSTIVLDEAHSTGVHGNQGSGLAVSLGLEEKVHIRIYTFGKAMGIHGACVSGTDTLRQYLINFARPFIYTTALPPHSISSIHCAFDYLSQHIELQHVLDQKIQVYVDNIADLSNRTNSQSAIQTVVLPGNKNARQAAFELQQHTFDVRPILSPTVSAGSERLRICLHTFNSDEEIIQLTNHLKKLAIKN
jgi:8-amino-7-oxononanoate synthase